MLQFCGIFLLFTNNKQAEKLVNVRFVLININVMYFNIYDNPFYKIEL